MTKTMSEQTDKIRAAYSENAPFSSTGYVPMAWLRESAGLIRADFDAAMRELARSADVILVPDEMPGRLSDAERGAAVTLAGQAKHYMIITA
jgi:hypothetical protein